VIFLHKIAAGSTDKSYGIHVARLAGLPGAVLERATGLLAELEGRHLEAKNRPAPTRPRRRERPVQPSLFSELEEGFVNPPAGEGNSFSGRDRS